MEAQMYQVKNTFLDLDDDLEFAFQRRQQSEPAARHPDPEDFIECQDHSQLPVENLDGKDKRCESPEKDPMMMMPRVLTGENIDLPHSEPNQTCQPGYHETWNSFQNEWPGMSNYMMISMDGSNISNMANGWPYGCGTMPIAANTTHPSKMFDLQVPSTYGSYQKYGGEAPAGEVLQAGKDFPLNFVPHDASFNEFSPSFGASVWGTWELPNLPNLPNPTRQTTPQTPQGSPKAGSDDVPSNWKSVSTVMARNLPNKYNQQMLIEELDNAGLAGAYDFLYLPIDPETNANRGYAFINFTSANYAWMMRTTYEGQKMGKFNSDKVMSVVPATLQGFEANYAHYSTARVMRGPPHTRPLFLRECNQKIKTERRRGGRRTQGSLIDLAVRHKEDEPHAFEQNLGQQTACVSPTGKSGEQMCSPGNRGDRSQMRFCQSCGGKAGLEFRFCQFCGVPLHFEVWGA